MVYINCKIPFLTYIKDIPETANSSETKLFAGDSLIHLNQDDSNLLERYLTSLED
jgi:hypothetical protein